jgi:hypothetical protein
VLARNDTHAERELLTSVLAGAPVRPAAMAFDLVVDRWHYWNTF